MTIKNIIIKFKRLKVNMIYEKPKRKPKQCKTKTEKEKGKRKIKGKNKDRKITNQNLKSEK